MFLGKYNGNVYVINKVIMNWIFQLAGHDASDQNGLCNDSKKNKIPCCICNPNKEDRNNMIKPPNHELYHK